MSTPRRRFTQEFKDELCREVVSTSKPIKDVAVAYGVGPETLRNWLIKYREANGGTEADLTVSERARLKELERENQDLRAETAFLNYPDVRIMPMFVWRCWSAGLAPLILRHNLA